MSVSLGHRTPLSEKECSVSISWVHVAELQSSWARDSMLFLLSILISPCSCFLASWLFLESLLSRPPQGWFYSDVGVSISHFCYPIFTKEVFNCKILAWHLNILYEGPCRHPASCLSKSPIWSWYSSMLIQVDLLRSFSLLNKHMPGIYSLIIMRWFSIVAVPSSAFTNVLLFISLCNRCTFRNVIAGSRRIWTF